MKKPRLHTDDTGFTDHDRFERDEAAYDREQEGRFEDERDRAYREDEEYADERHLDYIERLIGRTEDR